jgi:alkanesulfonate monooxygenase SsuD/methylene tetrahydromethanopterin reductase-like flavin-dependent oxidoreductase (luciferase family)
MASVTSTSRIGTLVTSTAYRNPSVIAKQAVTVDHVSGGRLDLGVGAGANPRDAAAAGESRLPGISTAQRFDESVRAISLLMRNDVTTYRGGRLRYDDVIAVPRAVQTPAPPLIVAGHRAGSIRLAAEVGDGWCSYGGTTSLATAPGRVASDVALERTRARIERLDEFAANCHRNGSTIRRIFLAGFTDDEPLASPTAFEDFLGRYRDIGITELAFLYPTNGVPRAQFERLLGSARWSSG